MGDYKIYFRDPEDHIRIWFKDTYLDNGSTILKDYMKQLYENNGRVTKNPEENVEEMIEEKLRLVFSDVLDAGTEKAWLAEMNYVQMDGVEIVHRRLAEFRTRNPGFIRETDSAFRRLFPTLASVSGV